MKSINKVNFKLIGEVKASTTKVGNPTMEYVYEDSAGITYVNSKGKFTSSGVENWFVPTKNYQEYEGVLFLEQKDFNKPYIGIIKLKNSQIDLGEREFHIVYNDLPELNAKDLI